MVLSIAILSSPSDIFSRMTSFSYSDPYFLGTAFASVMILTIVPLRTFTRPPPVPPKELPRRPALSILFKPDDTTATTLADSVSMPESVSRLVGRTASSYLMSSFGTSSSLDEEPVETVKENGIVGDHQSAESSLKEETVSGSTAVEGEYIEVPLSDTPAETPGTGSSDLPDSFAPLLSSSQTEILLDHLTADLIHGIRGEATVRMQPGSHEVPLNKDSTRPQFTIAVPKDGCKLTVVGSVGSDNMSTEDDLDVTIPTPARSRPLVKNAALTFDPPLPLVNVAPTLIHFPTLFEDNTVLPRLRRIPIVRYMVEVIVATSSLIEKVLWLVESQLQVHLGKVRIIPFHKGGGDSSDWRLTLAFSGHAQLFGFIPVPFLSVSLPSFIIPQPHALLEYLMSKQPLASARIHREKIAEERIAIAMLDTIDSWTSQVELVATPPAVGIDLTLLGGVSLGMELLYGRDPTAGRSRQDTVDGSLKNDFPASTKAPTSGASLSSWTTANDATSADFRPRKSHRSSESRPYDANLLVPWKMDLAAKGSMHKEKMSFHLLNCTFQHEESATAVVAKSFFKVRGSLAVWKAGADVHPDLFQHKARLPPYAHRAALQGATEPPSVAALLLYQEETESFHREYGMLQYDYAFDVSEDSKIDAITYTVGGNHPMLNGGNMVTTILESVYGFGSVTARQHAVLDPAERRRKRTILRHLPAIDFTFGIQNLSIPPESQSYLDDGQTKSFPEVDGGRVRVRFIGGIHDETEAHSTATGLSVDESDSEPEESPVADGIKVVADFGISSFVMNSETAVKEFPELDIFEGAKLRSLTSAKMGCTTRLHLRPQEVLGSSALGANHFNPLEAFEVDCSGTNVTMTIKESMSSLGHRRLIIPTETTVKVKLVESIVDMAMEGRSNCELSWDFQGLSPILQVTDVGLNPESVGHEKKEQVSLLIAPLRQGRLNFQISPVGGIKITKAATSREDKEGLYDWKFFNALVSPDEQSAERLFDVVHDKRTMNKVLQVVKLVSNDAHRFAKYILDQVWRLKDILDKEGVSDPRHVIPAHRMARLASLLLCDDLRETATILPMLRRVFAGDGLDVIKVKELLHKHSEFYEDWAAEIDRIVRWFGTLSTPVAVPPMYVDNHVTPLAQQQQYSARFGWIPSAAELYAQIHDRPHLPLDRKLSNLVGRIASYLSFHQIEYFLKIRSAKHWQPSDLKRLRYVFSVKKRVMEIAESYGGLSFLPQSFLVSVFLGEATRSSLRVEQPSSDKKEEGEGMRLGLKYSHKPSTLANLRVRRASVQNPVMSSVNGMPMGSVKLSAAGRVAALANTDVPRHSESRSQRRSVRNREPQEDTEQYQLGDCLLGPADVAILLQAGLASVMKGSSVVQLNQRMLLDLIASQPTSFAVSVLAEIGSPGGQGSPRQLTSALMALLDLDQSSFQPVHRLDMHILLEKWLPGLKVPRRDDYMAGGRWARQSYYDSLYALAKSILEDAECYMAVKAHIQRYRHSQESDNIPGPKDDSSGVDFNDSAQLPNKLSASVDHAREAISFADQKGKAILAGLKAGRNGLKQSNQYSNAVVAYREAFAACAKVRDIDKLSFHADWFREFYRRNYDALMIKSMYDNVVNNVDKVRNWLHCLRRGAKFGAPHRDDNKLIGGDASKPANIFESILAPFQGDMDPDDMPGVDRIFLEPERHSEQKLVDAIIDATIYNAEDRQRLKDDPLVRLLIPNPPGRYDFTVVTAMGVITDGKAGTELQSAVNRLERIRGVKTIRADTATVRSFEYNASKIIEAIASARELGAPYGLLGYSQGCANALMAEATLYSGTPEQQQEVTDGVGLVCRQLLYSAANSSIHSSATEIKALRLTVQMEDFFKYQQGYFSRALQSTFLDLLVSALDSPQFHKTMGGAESLFADGCRAFWREAQMLAQVPTCTLRSVLEEHTTPEALELLANMLTKQSGSALHDSQVHVHDAVGYPIYHKNRNGRIMEKCDVGDGAIQRTHHWSPLDEEVDFLATHRDEQMASFSCAKDRHLFPWIEVNARFGFIKFAKTANSKPK